VKSVAPGPDEARLRELTDPFRREIQAHCYRLLGSLEDAEDLLQETLLRAWRGRDSFDGRAPRAWLYRIATNACLDALRDRPRRTMPAEASAPSDPLEPVAEPLLEPVWMQPYPDALVADVEAGPEAQVSLRQSVGLAFLVALQRLAPRQRAVLVLRDVVGWTANEVAESLGDSVASVNSALQRAREALERPQGESEGSVRTSLTPDEESLLERLVQAWEHGDPDGVAALLRHDVVFHMPPLPTWYRGRDAVAAGLRHRILAGDARGRFRFLRSAANGQPTLAAYIQDPQTGEHRPFGLLVLSVAGDEITQVALFSGASLFGRFGLPATLTR
jgi:RNA polymerase sigma-70 factor (ECF subfamily)